MRKILNIFTAVALAATATVGFTACSDDDDDSPKQQTSLKCIEWEMDGEVGVDNSKIFNYNVTIALPNGETRMLPTFVGDKESEVSGKILASDVTLPAEFTMTINRTVNPEYKYNDGDKANLSEDIDVSLALIGSDDKVITILTRGHEAVSNGVDLAKYLPERGDQTNTVTLTVKKTSDGYTIE